VPYFNLRVFLKCPDGTSVRGKGFFNCVCSSTEKTRIQNADPNAVKFLTTNYVVLDFDLNDKKKKWTIGRPGLIKRHAMVRSTCLSLYLSLYRHICFEPVLL
jgi:hypothetical protein